MFPLLFCNLMLNFKLEIPKHYKYRYIIIFLYRKYNKKKKKLGKFFAAEFKNVHYSTDC